jgi:hypothetical protein
MKAFLAGLGAGIIVGMIFAPASDGRARKARQPWRLRYEWRDPDDRLARSEPEIREKMMDKTLADSFPASDPPSTIPNPSEDSLVA